MNQKWLKPLHFVTVDPKTKNADWIGLTEVERHQEHIKKVTDISGVRKNERDKTIRECQVLRW